MDRSISPGQPPDQAAADGAVKRARDRIFEVAKELFYRRGIRAVGVETIVTQAGATKMSLYRSYPSKDDLVVAYLRARDASYWRWWDRTVGAHPDAPRAQLLALFQSLAGVAARPDYRGCPFTNAAVEFPEPDHPARLVAEANKRALRDRLRDLAAAAGAGDPAGLADQLVLLAEGAYSSSQTFGPDGPAAVVLDAARILIDAALADPARPGEAEAGTR